MALREEFALSNGMRAVFQMPDIPALVAGSHDLPNAALAGVLDLLLGGAIPADPAQRLSVNISQAASIYEVVALCLAEPKLKISRNKKRPVALKAGEIEPADLSWVEVVDIYNRFRYGVLGSPSPAAAAEPGDREAAPPAGDDLPHDAQ